MGPNLVVRSHTRYPIAPHGQVSNSVFFIIILVLGSNPRPSAHKTDALPN